MIDKTLDPLKEVIVTNGAYEALYCSILGNIQEGDEVILIEPFFDCYAPMVKAAGGIPVYIPLRPV
jgi:kynurenine--oxoglutarate transaminase/cysteine-S-conjugate beta-lyase/glutamine--phenylpyruvate transaminase